MTTFTARPVFDLNDPMMMSDRYELYRRMREKDPIHHSPHGYWVLTRYDDCDAFLRAPGVMTAFVDDPEWARARGGPNCPIVKSARRWVLVKDGAEHKRLRRLISRALTPAAVERLRPRIAALVNELIDQMGDGEADLISGLALPLPVAVVCELLGIPIQDAELVRQWTNTIANVVDPVITPRMRIQMNRAEPEFRAYLLDQLSERRRQPRDDFLSMMLEPDPSGERLSDEDIAAQALVLFNAGHETSINIIGNATVALLENPGQMRLLRERPELVEQSFEELARYNSAVQIAARRTSVDVALGDATIPADSAVFAVLGAAHRDPARYPDPDRLDVTRSGPKSLAFGSGPHYCIAASLGRLEVVMTFQELLRRYRTIELATSDLEWYSHFKFLLGLKRLPLRLAFA